MAETRPLISIVVPIYNEAGNIQQLYEAVTRTIATLPYRFEIIFVNDGSVDDSAAKLGSLARQHTNVRVVELARNFGKEIATTAGLQASGGLAAIVMDADLQHPPEIIPDFLTRWEAGADVVIGVRQRAAERSSAFKRLASAMFYRFMKRVSQTHIVPNATDYRLVDRVVIDAFNRFTEHNRLTRGLIDWLGFERSYVYFEPNPRYTGRATYTFGKLVSLALSSIVGHTLLPLRLAGYLGAATVVTSGALGLFIYIEKYVMGDPAGYNFSGPAILAVIIVFLSGIILSCIGLMGLYIASIHNEVLDRPLYVIRHRRPRPHQDNSKP